MKKHPPSLYQNLLFLLAIVLIAIVQILIFSPQAHAGDKVSIRLNDVPVATLIQLVNGEIIKRPFSMDNDVLTSNEKISLFLADYPVTGLASAIDSLLDSRGFRATQRGGIATYRKPGADELDSAVYKPRHRTAAYLLALVKPLYGPCFGAMATQGSGMAAKTGLLTNTSEQPATTATTSTGTQPTQQQNQEQEGILYRCTPAQAHGLSKALAALDTPADEVIIKGVVYEVTKRKHDASAVDLVLSLLSSRLGLSSVLGAASSTALSLKLGTGENTINAVWTALSSDDRFNAVSSPRLRVRSGSKGRIVVGDETPVITGVSYDANGRQTQSVTYRQSGVIFEIQPAVMEKTVELRVNQQVSQFQSTTTGVNTTPTLVKRELETVVTTAGDDLLVIGGLESKGNTDSVRGLSFTPDWLRATTADDNQTELVLILQAQRL